MTVRFLLGAAGSGKTECCLVGVREELARAPEGRPLLFLTPKQATFQIERGVLGEAGLAGYTRLQILSFERLARMILDETDGGAVQLLDEEGRRMVLRALLAERQPALRVFHATARLPGFAAHLSLLLGEFQRQRLGPDSLTALAKRCAEDVALADKLLDLSLMLGGYLEWLAARGLHDPLSLLDLATARIQRSVEGRAGRFGGLWLDGFAELTEQELELLVALVTRSEASTLAFCLPTVPEGDPPWLSVWSAVSQTFRRVWNRLAAEPNLELETVLLPMAGQPTRFDSSPVLGHLAREFHSATPLALDEIAPGQSVRLAVCPDPEGEAILAAREILDYVRGDPGRRFRGVGVLLRSLEGYHDVLRRVFRRYEIPFFIDRREPVAHHPLAELTRYALRTVAFGWRREDWFGALKSGLAPAPDSAIDELENEALARGWEGPVWLDPIELPDEPWLERRLERTRLRVVPPFRVLAEAVATSRDQVTGGELSRHLLAFWESLRVRDRLDRWADTEPDENWMGRQPGAVHGAVWDQMRLWLENVERAFPDRALTLSEWLPVLESGLSGLTVGVIPPALDQVMIGTVDRSRNPDLDMALVLGLNDTVFPALPPGAGLLSESDRDRLVSQGLRFETHWRGWAGRERYYGYIALTRARRRLVLTCSEQDGSGRKLNPSPFLASIERAWPGLRREQFAPPRDWLEATHWNELLTLAIAWRRAAERGPAGPDLDALLSDHGWLDRINRLARYDPGADLSASTAQALYGPVLRTSVSALEQFAACPFRFFVQSGLRAAERRQFEIDARERGSFQHEVLARFHESLQAKALRWRDLKPTEARDRIAHLATAIMEEYRDGLFQSAPERAFEAERLGRLLQDYIEVAVEWMAHYRFDPVAVELAFGGRSDRMPAWELDLGNGRMLAFRGKIDRVDLASDSDSNEGLCVVIDYKAGDRKFDDVLLEHGIQIQLPAYLAALSDLSEPGPLFGVDRLVPVGVFYVNLRGRHASGTNRQEVLEAGAEARRLAYRHTGRFDASHLRMLDGRTEATAGEQFNYRLTTKGAIHGGCREPLDPASFARMLVGVRARLRAMGDRIYSGAASVDPYRHGTVTACDHCVAGPICRIDPWIHRYRRLDRSNPPNTRKKS